MPEFPALGITEPMMWAITAVIGFMILDMITGFMGAWHEKNIDSTKMREGLFHKGALIMIIVMAWLIEITVLHVPDLGFTVPLLIPACIGIISMEVVSNLENLAKINPSLANSPLMELFRKVEKIPLETDEVKEGDHAKRD